MKLFLITTMLFFFTVSAIAATVNINIADKKALEALPGIDDVKAEAIMTYRKAHTFKSIDELAKIKGVGEKTVKNLKKQITVTGE